MPPSSSSQEVPTQPNAVTWVHARKRTVLAVLAAAVFLIGAFFVAFMVAPSSFPRNEIITISEGTSVIETAAVLEDAGAIRSALLFRLVVGNRGVRAGSYVFAEPKGLIPLAISIVRGDGGMAPVRITFPEGMTVREMADVLKERLASFDKASFVASTTNQEGYLFPDTYFFSPFATVDEVVEKLRTTFDTRVAELAPEIEASSRSFSDVVIMASLLEKEAKTLEDKRMVAGILWKRLDIDMALQVDAVFGYIKGTETYHPSLVDLEIDSPYNTYRNRGLPPTAIANPGLESIEAALTPIPSDYLYYLTGTDGAMRYARTFDEHRANRAKYLD